MAKIGMPKGIYQHKKGIKKPGSGIYKRNSEMKTGKHMLGRKLPKEWRENIGKAEKGEKNWRWITDRTKLAKRQERNDVAYKEWRADVFKRDSFRCKINNQDCSGKIKAHHILGWTKFPELRYEVNNGITLCQFHHPRKRIDEIKLLPIFQELVGVKVN